MWAFLNSYSLQGYYSEPTNLKDDSLCSNCAQELSNIGGYPRFIYDPLTVKGLNDTLIQQYAGKHPWLSQKYNAANRNFSSKNWSNHKFMVFALPNFGRRAVSFQNLFHRIFESYFGQAGLEWCQNKRTDSLAFCSPRRIQLYGMTFLVNHEPLLTREYLQSVLGDISAIIPPSKSYNPSSFSFHFMPYRSALWIGVFSSNFTSSAIVTGNEFSSIKNLRFDFPASTYSSMFILRHLVEFRSN